MFHKQLLLGSLHGGGGPGWVFQEGWEQPQGSIMPNHGPCLDRVGKVQPKISPGQRLTTWLRQPGGVQVFGFLQEKDYGSVALSSENGPISARGH